MFDFILNVLWTVFIIFYIVLLCRNFWVFNRRDKLNRFENGVHVIK